MAGLDPAIHGSRYELAATWMPGSSPGMTIGVLRSAYPFAMR
jgi:hypothetical protein